MFLVSPVVESVNSFKFITEHYDLSDFGTNKTAPMYPFILLGIGAMAPFSANFFIS